jgi:hypothetical protein
MRPAKLASRGSTEKARPVDDDLRQAFTSLIRIRNDGNLVDRTSDEGGYMSQELDDILDAVEAALDQAQYEHANAAPPESGAAMLPGQLPGAFQISTFFEGSSPGAFATLQKISPSSGAESDTEIYSAPVERAVFVQPPPSSKPFRRLTTRKSGSLSFILRPFGTIAIGTVTIRVASVPS